MDANIFSFAKYFTGTNVKDEPQSYKQGLIKSRMTRKSGIILLELTSVNWLSEIIQQCNYPLAFTAPICKVVSYEK